MKRLLVACSVKSSLVASGFKVTRRNSPTAPLLMHLLLPYGVSERRSSERVRSFLVRGKQSARQVELESRLLHAVGASKRVVGSDMMKR